MVRLDLSCQKCANAAFHFCIRCESRDVQADSDYERLCKEIALEDDVWMLQHPNWVKEDVCADSSGS